MLVGEVAWLGVVAIPAGLLGGLSIGKALAALLAERGFRIPFALTLNGVGQSLTVYAVAVGIACLLVAQRIWSLNLVSVLKTRD